MAAGIWDQTLFNAIQASVHECLKYSVVRTFGEYLTKKRSLRDPNKADSPAHVMLGRYECALHRQNQKSYGTLRAKGPNALGWLKKKTQTVLHSDRPPKKEKKSSFLGKSKKIKVDSPCAADPPASSSDEEDDICALCVEQHDDTADLVEPVGASQEEKLAHRERLTQQRLQQQIQILRNLHQRQTEIFEAEHASPPPQNTIDSSGSHPLTKSISLPSILSRGVSMKNKN